MDMNQFNDEELHQALNLETAQISWTELQRQFASGRLIKVSNELDLVKTAMKFVRDDKQAIEKWIEAGQIHPATDDDARLWNEKQADFWSVVVAPWVLVQEIQAPGEKK
ncbi:MAG: DUF2288 domain-containing protein [Thioalkalispiraceae bacterium]|jgi:hypothetical protein